MKPTEFCYWLQGYFELADHASHEQHLTTEQVEVIKNHLNLVFYHSIDPSYNGDQKLLQEIHDGLKPKLVEQSKPSKESPSDGSDPLGLPRPTIYRC